MTISNFRKVVWKYYRKEGRHDLPWRPPTLKLRRDKTYDPYKILVSEVMLQQTQVDRVIPLYKNFIKKFPTPARLASASLASVLQTWQGLGYNRRAKRLKTAAGLLTTNIQTVEELEKLPGVGPYTARAVAAFAFNQDVVFVETNIRTAITHHFYPKKKKVSDAEIEKILQQALPKGRAGEWYAALMDYGAYLKRSGIKLNARHAKYVKQSKFAGSSREARGAILRELSRGSRSELRLLSLLGNDRIPQLRSALAALLSEGLIEKQKRGRVFTLPR